MFHQRLVVVEIPGSKKSWVAKLRLDGLKRIFETIHLEINQRCMKIFMKCIVLYECAQYKF